MLVSTALGPLMVADPPSGTESLWAEAVRLCARDMTSAVGKLPDPLRPAGRLYARASCGDAPNRDAVRAIETQDLPALSRWQATLPDVAETDSLKLAEAHSYCADELRGATGRLLKIANLLRAGRAHEAHAALQRMRSVRGIDPAGAPLATLGAWRAHTGMDLSVDWEDDDPRIMEVP